MFALQGDQASMADVAAAAGMARATVYRYFPNRRGAARRAGARPRSRESSERLRAARLDAVPAEEASRVRSARSSTSATPSSCSRASARPSRGVRAGRRRAAARAVRARRRPTATCARPPGALADGVAASGSSSACSRRPVAGRGGHDRGDQRPLPRRSPRPGSAPRMNDHDRQETPMADRHRGHAGQPSRSRASCSSELVAYLRENRTELREEWARASARPSCCG